MGLFPCYTRKFLQIDFVLLIQTLLEILSDCHIKTCQSLKWKAIYSAIFLEAMLFLLTVA